MMQMMGHNGGPSMVLDAQGYAFVEGQSYKINQTVLEARYPDWNVGELAFVDTSGPAWGAGIWTWTSNITAAGPKWQSGYAKDVPMADVNQDKQLKTFQLAALGYQWNIEEINTTLATIGGRLDQRRARACVIGARAFLWNLAFGGDTEKGMTGMSNYAGVTTIQPAADGTGSARHWVDASGVGTKTPAQIVRDFNIMLNGIDTATFGIALADTVWLPKAAYDYIAQTPYSTTTMDTILTFVQRTNAYTTSTGRPLTIRSFRELNTAATSTSPSNQAGNGRAVAYRNDPNTVKFHLPMPFQFLPVYQDGPFNFAVPGILRTGGTEILDTNTFRYMDGVSLPPA